MMRTTLQTFTTQVAWFVLLFSVPVSEAKEQIKRLGPVVVTTTLTPDTPIIGDEVVLEVRVEAAADVEVLMPEFGEALDRYDILDFVPKETVQDDGTTIRIQRYTLQPNLSGRQSIPPVLVEFVDNRPGEKPSPEDYDAYEVLTERLDFEVKSVLPDGATTDLKPALGKLTPRVEVSPTQWGLMGVGCLALLGVLGAGVVAIRRWQRRRLQKSAYDIARQWLDYELAKPAPQTDEQVEAFFVAISKIVRAYLENRFEIRAPDLTTEEFLELAGTSSDLSHAHQTLLRDFLRQADLVKFAGMKATAVDVNRAGILARQFLEETRDNAPVIDVGEGHALQREEQPVV